MEKLLLPSSITFEKGATANRGQLVITPLFHGYGTTVGNAIRRVLLSSLPGAAITAMKVRGIPHEFAAIPGIKEDGVEILLNVKQIRLKVFSLEPVKLQLTIKKNGVITAGDIVASSDAEVMNKDLVLFTATDVKAPIEIEFTAEQGRGYVPVEDREDRAVELGTIAVDAIYTPVMDVGYTVEFTRVGDITNYEKLTIDIETDGTITPEFAANEATKLLMEHFNLIIASLGGVKASE
ncbi:MAG: DNA-directed RNA polymerase subunit alpha [Candidatus Magasanikbacteria bacterium]|nr:DNA-directed RNA polymerase subunit alpha [Candidatus Magasanikbacteria bacterium]